MNHKKIILLPALLCLTISFSVYASYDSKHENVNTLITQLATLHARCGELNQTRENLGHAFCSWNPLDNSLTEELFDVYLQEYDAKCAALSQEISQCEGVALNLLVLPTTDIDIKNKYKESARDIFEKSEYSRIQALFTEFNKKRAPLLRTTVMLSNKKKNGDYKKIPKEIVCLICTFI